MTKRQEYLKSYYLKNKEKIKLLSSIRKKANKDKIKTQNKEWYLKNKLRLKEVRHKWYELNREAVKEKHSEYNRLNIDKTSVQKKEYYQRKKKEIRDRNRDRRKQNPIVRLVKRLRTRIWFALKHNKKVESTIELLGCSTDELKLHLQNQFTDNMNWNNYGKWHVDHIIPCAKFDLTKLEEQKKCFHYHNLQPLWAIDNLRKGAKICH